jgi:hypothetical protein
MKTENMVLHDLTNGNFVFATILKEGSVDSLVANKVLTKYEKVPRNISGDIYINDNKEIILKLVDEAILFENEQEFNAVVNDGYYSEVISHTVMFGKNKEGKEFYKNRLTLIKELLLKLNIKDNPKVDKNLLKRVECLIAQKEKPFHFYRENFANCLALIGEVFINYNNKLMWHMELDKDGKTWNPFLFYNGEKIALFLDVNKQIFRLYNKETPLSAVLENYL